LNGLKLRPKSKVSPQNWPIHGIHAAMVSVGRLKYNCPTLGDTVYLIQVHDLVDSYYPDSKPSRRLFLLSIIFDAKHRSAYVDI